MLTHSLNFFIVTKEYDWQVTTSVAIIQALRFCCNYAGSAFCYSYVDESFCCNHAGDCFCCLYVVRSFYSFTHMTISAANNIWVTVFIVIMQVGAVLQLIQVVCRRYFLQCIMPMTVLL